ncbi:hypothetical protein DXT63_16740 [Thermoanaerobacteraceae bacterium SP2]|nr:hypothetical protein DXT63_16740 [Thermoanaerobacteraceae bacterium SP2]
MKLTTGTVVTILRTGCNHPFGTIEFLNRYMHREKDNLKNYFSGDIHPYFKDFLTVSKHLYSLLGKPKGVGHTDIVKCCSNNFPPENINIKEAEKIKENCSVYLRNQILSFKPKIIVCNGTPVCDFFIKAFPPLRNLNGIYDNDTALGPWSL